MFQNLEPHLKALQEEYEKSNMGPILEKIAEEAQTAFTPAFEEMFRARHHHHQRGGPRAWGHPGFAGRCGSRDFGFRGAGAHHPFAAGHHHPFPSHPPTTATATTDSLPALSDRRWHRVTCDGCGARAFTGPRHRCADCRDYDLCATCFADVERVHGGLRGAGGGSHAERFVTMVHPADRVENEAVAALVGMGFEATEEVRELVRRYGGRVERVVELIVRERERAYDVDA
ncbi:hypothetical protein DFJ73DRAFT_819315 [Zopfochytrium polystomum]|nr:hypothetical protein DFJ73DRAFT_819315 [Zopfochytrium polystomum]